VGQLDRVNLAATGELSAATDALKAIERVQDATFGDGAIEVTAEGARTLLPEIIRVAAESGAAVSSVEVTEPDLEAVFLHLTGKALRD
jgi:ABC-2 type transport system ATP-binding protein